MIPNQNQIIQRKLESLSVTLVQLYCIPVYIEEGIFFHLLRTQT